MIRIAIAMALLATAGISMSATADTTITGEKKGAFFTMTVPDVWNGDLVISNHGFDFDAPEPNPGLGPLAARRRALQLLASAPVHFVPDEFHRLALPHRTQ